jgi:hypothetical protein
MTAPVTAPVVGPMTAALPPMTPCVRLRRDLVDRLVAEMQQACGTLRGRTSEAAIG